MQLVTCGDFAKLMRKRGCKAEYLIERLSGHIDRPRDFVTYALQGQYSATVIPFSSVLAFYSHEKATEKLPKTFKGSPGPRK